MWVIRRSIVDWDCSKTVTLLETLKITNQLREKSHVSSEVEHLFPEVGCVRNITADSEVISLDTGLRMDGIPALDLWDLVIEVLHSSENIQHASRNRCREEVNCQASRNRVRNETPSTNTMITLSQAQNFLTSKPSCTFLKTMRL